MESAPFTAGEPDFNFCRTHCRFEGTLAFITEIKLNIVPLPPKESGLLCVHFNTIDESLRANLIALKYKPAASELVDHYILECTKGNIEQSKNRFLYRAIRVPYWLVEFLSNDREDIKDYRCECRKRNEGRRPRLSLSFIVW